MNYAEASIEEVVGKSSGATWVVKNLGTEQAPNFIGHTRDYDAKGYRGEVHATKYEDVNYPGWGLVKSLVYDTAIHGNKEAFLAKLQEVDAQMSTRAGLPLVGAHVGPTPPLLVDGINGDPLPRLAPATEPTPRERALLSAGNLHPTDLGYHDHAADEWL